MSQQSQPSPLQTERGNTTIEDVVVSKVAGMAAQEVDGVQMGGGAQRAVGGLLGGLPGGSGGTTRGVTVQTGQTETVINLEMAVEYGRAIPQLTEAVRRNVISRVESLVGLQVRAVNIVVGDVILPQQRQQTEQEQASQQDQPRLR